ncbi:hypothetical protein HRI_000155600 [Hibiscus trionum]|uniref:Uncharacterized protein n=1 Tax=Hibiscus trionum TaxID=183268 RepID=A0A9W7LH83_HIBTR|nr:hypothetical protein HRI_000155600 [Hibiscus trionum]
MAKKDKIGAPSKGTEAQVTDKNVEKKRTASKDRLTTLEDKTERLETNARKAVESLDDVEECLEKLETKFVPLKGEVTEGVQKLLDEAYERLNRQDVSLQIVLESTRNELLGEIKKLSAELSLYKNVVLIGMASKTIEAKPRIDVQKPKEFKGARDTQEVDSFVWSLENYFRLTGIEDEDTKVNSASIYLVDAALLWWRHRCYQSKDGTIPTKTWK